ncbi:MAG TPA: 3'-5' exonuclease [Armatimonadota bacterium]|nr:3'-5' exonuclease [Armatimonadota bacterium]
MEFRIADTFTTSLARLTADEQRAAKTTAFDLQLDPSSPAMAFHRLDRAKDKNFWSVRASSDIRLIVHRTPGSLLLCYVDHHNAAYAWAERRKLETHPTTGAAQLVEIRETFQEILVPVYVEAPAQAKEPLFSHLSNDELLGFGVPGEWLDDVRRADEDTIWALVDHLPAEASEALVNAAAGGSPAPRPPVAANPYEHPDAQRRFRMVSDIEELARALEYPWEKWTTFLHPAQRDLVNRHFAGPARIAGSAGTGKTIVALHRAVFLARANPDVRVLLTTFSETLAGLLRAKIACLIRGEPRVGDRIDVDALEMVARRLYERRFGRASLVTDDVVGEIVRAAATTSTDQKFSPSFLMSEWEGVIDAWQLTTWESYRDVARLGRRTRLTEKQRQALWEIFERVRASLAEQGFVTKADLYSRLANDIAGGGRSPYDFAVVDEAQDVSAAQLRLLAALGGGRPDSLFFAGDLGQRIFQLPFSWRSLGVDIRGRSATLKINYRTSHQIRAQADRLLGAEVTDVDGVTEDRRATISVFNGPPPDIRALGTPEEEIEVVARWLAARTKEGVKPEEMGVFVRSSSEIPRARAAVEAAGLPLALLDSDVKLSGDQVSVATMHLSKGLEFRSVVVMACDDEVLPLQARMEALADASDLEEVYDTERHLLYVACTRARDHLLVTGVRPISEFLEDLQLS